MIAWHLRAMARSSEDRSGRIVTRNSSGGFRSRGWIQRHTAGISISENTEPLCTPGLGWVSSGPWPGSREFLTFEKLLPSRGRYIGCIRRLYFVPQLIQHAEPGGRHIDAPIACQTFHRLEAPAKLAIGPIQRRSGLHSSLPGQIDRGEKQIPDLLHDRLASGATWGIRVGIRRLLSRRLVTQFGLDLRQLFPDLLDGSRGIGPVEANGGGSLLESEG